MKDLCENIFCFWRKWCQKQINSLVSIESSKLISNEKEEDMYSTITTPIKPIENTSLQNKPEIEMSTALPIADDIIFPSKYLNEAEENPNIQFEFTKERIIKFIEDYINDHTSFRNLINKDGFDIYIKDSGTIFNSQLPLIKTYHKMMKSDFKRKDVTVKLIEKYMNDENIRIKWDKSIRYYKIVEKQSDEVYVLHYICKSPMIFVSERDIVDKRYDFYVDGIYYDFSSSVKNDIVPEVEEVVRMTDYVSVFKLYEEEDCFTIIALTQVDTKFTIPSAMLTVQLPIKYKEWYDGLVNEINEGY